MGITQSFREVDRHLLDAIYLHVKLAGAKNNILFPVECSMKFIPKVQYLCSTFVKSFLELELSWSPAASDTASTAIHAGWSGQCRGVQWGIRQLDV